MLGEVDAALAGGVAEGVGLFLAARDCAAKCRGRMSVEGFVKEGLGTISLVGGSSYRYVYPPSSPAVQRKVSPFPWLSWSSSSAAKSSSMPVWEPLGYQWLLKSTTGPHLLVLGQPDVVLKLRT